MKNKFFIIIFLAIILLASFLRLFSLGEIPNGLQQDETSIGYNAYSLLETSKDEYGKTFPLFFKAFGEYKLPLSIYLTAASFSIFGVSEFSLRLPSALFGIASVFLIYFLARELFKKESIALICMGIMAINPWHLHFSRGAYEVSPALFFIILGVYMCLLYWRLSSSLFLFLGLMSLGLSMYGYNIARLFTPLFIISIAIVDQKRLVKLNRQKMVLPFIGLAFVILSLAIVLFNKGGYESTRGTLIPTSAVVQASNLEVRSYFIESNPIFAKIISNAYVMNAVYYLKNFVSYFNVDFLFLNGSKHGNHGIGNAGQFYLFELVTIIFGLITLLKSKAKTAKILLVWLLIVISVASLTREAPQATRSFFAIPPLVMFSGFGIYTIYNSLFKYHKLFIFCISTLIVLISSIIVLQYFASYYFRFPKLYAKNFRSEDKVLVKFLNKNYEKYDVIYIDKKADLIYSSILFYSRFSPLEFQNNSIRERDDSEGFSKVAAFGKYQYIDLDNIPDFNKALIITNQAKSGFAEIARFDYPTRPVVAAQGQQIINFPVTENAYVLLEKN